MSFRPLFTKNKPIKPASASRRRRRLGSSLQCLEDRRMMAGDVALLPIEAEYVDVSTLAPNTTEWTLDPLADFEFAGGADPFEQQLTASGEIDPNDLIFSASIVPTLAQELDARYDLMESDDYHTNCLGQNERWVRSNSGGWFFLTPEGDFFQWRGSFNNSRHLATFDASYYDNPDLIAEPETADVEVVIEGDVLKIIPGVDYTGSFQVAVGATNGFGGATDLVLVTVTPPEPIDDFKAPTNEDDPGGEEDPEELPTPPPVLMVIANHDFYYQEYADTRTSLEEAGLEVVVAAASTDTATPHNGSGQVGSGEVTPDLSILDASADDYSAIVFVGGWGSSMYQYAYEGTYDNGYYNGTEAVKLATNELINDFVDQNKYVTAICHGVSVLAWARVDGVSPIDGKTVSAWANTSPGSDTAFNTTRQEIEYNGGIMVESGSVGVAGTAEDDVIVDGRIITAENYDSASVFGDVIGEMVNDPAYIDEIFAEWE
ncbi:hypothetical protein [Blastopirellula marina]|uniref:DJ-1/PfpI domain-containing protein n=1 Tax=Blastopirellula marina TaxID=124 RepID=A0A2S8GBZ3_9BACT|nr:hypothetical protein [Blastopirellula marina]PQO41978.1 hypothetical protein C5Y93_26825 [Blastopirellula marina]